MERTPRGASGSLHPPTGTTRGGASGPLPSAIGRRRRSAAHVEDDQLRRPRHLAPRYGDRAMTPGTNLTFFEHSGALANRRGRRSLSETALRVGSVADLDWWADRLTS